MLHLIGILGDRIAILVKLWRLLATLHVVLLRLSDDARACFLKVNVVCKEVALFRIDNRLNYLLGVLSQFLQYLHNNVHDDWSQRWEPQKDSVDDGACE